MQRRRLLALLRPVQDLLNASAEKGFTSVSGSVPQQPGPGKWRDDAPPSRTRMRLTVAQALVAGNITGIGLPGMAHLKDAGERDTGSRNVQEGPQPEPGIV
jgi:hypothetical protein